MPLFDIPIVEDFSPRIARVVMGGLGSYNNNTFFCATSSDRCQAIPH